MKILLLILVLVLLLGPFRRPFLRRARFTIPATVAGLAAYALGSWVVARSGVQHPVAALIPFAMAAGAAIGAGEAAKRWCDETFGKQERDHDRRRD